MIYRECIYYLDDDDTWGKCMKSPRGYIRGSCFGCKDGVDHCGRNLVELDAEIERNREQFYNSHKKVDHA